MSETNRMNNLSKDENDDDDEEVDDVDDDDENHWYYPRTSSPHSSLSVNNSFTHQSSSATMGSWGFDVNRSTNGQTPLSFTSNNNNNSDQQIITRPTKDYNERLIDIPSSSPQNSKFRTPTLTKHRNGNEFAAVDRLLLGPNRTSNDSFPQQQQQQMTPSNQQKIQAEQELIAWQNRMLQRDQRIDSASPKLSSKRNGTNSVHSSSRQTLTAPRRIPAMLNTNENQYSEHDHHESTIKSARVMKRYIELIYHLQSFYERITDQLFHGNSFSKTNQSSPSFFTSHCRKIAEQLQKFRPIWEDKLVDLQSQLKHISSSQWSTGTSQATFLQRRLTLINLIQILRKETELDDTDLSMRADIDRVLHEDKLAVQLQDELSTLLQHQSLLNDFTSLLIWNRSIYSSSEQNHVDNILPILREQMTTTDSYMSHVSQQLTELVTSLRSSEKYILSYTNTIPSIDDEMKPKQRTSSNHSHWRSYDKTDVLPQSHPNEYPSSKNSEKKMALMSSVLEARSTSISRHVDSDEFSHDLNRDNLRVSLKNLNTNNSNNNGPLTRFATIKSAKRDQHSQSNVKSILKSYPQRRSSNGRKKDFDIDTEISIPNKVDIPDRLIDFDTNDHMLTTNERREKMKKKEDVRKMLAKQNIHEANDQDLTDDDDMRLPIDRRGFSKEREKALNLQSILAEEAKEKSRQVAVKHYLNKSYQQRLTYPNA